MLCWLAAIRMTIYYDFIPPVIILWIMVQGERMVGVANLFQHVVIYDKGEASSVCG